MKFSPAFLSLLFLAVSAAPTAKVAREDANVDALYSLTPEGWRGDLAAAPESSRREEAREVEVDSVFFVENESWNPANDRRELTVDAGFLVTTPEHWTSADARRELTVDAGFFVENESWNPANDRRELTVDAGFLVTTPEHWAGADA